MPQFCLVRKALLAVSRTGEKRIVLIPEGANVRVIASRDAAAWATVEWDGIELSVFKQDLDQRIAPLPKLSRSQSA